MYAVVISGGKQYKVEENQILEVDRISAEKNSQHNFKDILLIRNDERILIGNPFIPGASVKAKIIDHIKGEKIDVARYKAKVRYRKKIGFRPYLTKLLIEKIEIGAESNSKKKADSRVKSGDKK